MRKNRLLTMFFVLIGFVFCTMTYGQSQFEANVTEHVESNVTQEKSNERQTSDVRKATSQDQGHRAEYYIKNVSHTFADNKSLGRTLIVNFDLNVNGCKGRSLYFIGELEYLDNGTWKPKYSAPALSYVNSRTGQVTAISPDYQCNDDAAEKSGIVLPIPARRISHPEGTEQYRLVIYMMDNNGAGRYPYKDNGSYPEYRFSVDWGYKNPQVPCTPLLRKCMIWDKNTLGILMGGSINILPLTGIGHQLTLVTSMELLRCIRPIVTVMKTLSRPVWIRPRNGLTKG